jgi:hypothetical protein
MLLEAVVEAVEVGGGGLGVVLGHDGVSLKPHELLPPCNKDKIFVSYIMNYVRCTILAAGQREKYRN